MKAAVKGKKRKEGTDEYSILHWELVCKAPEYALLFINMLRL